VFTVSAISLAYVFCMIFLFSETPAVVLKHECNLVNISFVDNIPWDFPIHNVSGWDDPNPNTQNHKNKRSIKIPSVHKFFVFIGFSNTTSNDSTLFEDVRECLVFGDTTPSLMNRTNAYTPLNETLSYIQQDLEYLNRQFDKAKLGGYHINISQLNNVLVGTHYAVLESLDILNNLNLQIQKTNMSIEENASISPNLKQEYIKYLNDAYYATIALEYLLNLTDCWYYKQIYDTLFVTDFCTNLLGNMMWLGIFAIIIVISYLPMILFSFLLGYRLLPLRAPFDESEPETAMLLAPPIVQPIIQTYNIVPPNSPPINANVYYAPALTGTYQAYNDAYTNQYTPTAPPLNAGPTQYPQGSPKDIGRIIN